MDGRAAPVAVATDPVAAPHRPIAGDTSGRCDGRRPHVHRPLHVSDSNACRQPDYRSGVRGSRRAVESVRPAPRFLHCAAIWFALGRSTAGQRLASSRRPLRWPPSRPPSTYAAARHLPKSVLFRRSVIAIQPRNNRLWATHSVGVRGGATPPAVGSRAPTPCRCRPYGRRSPSPVGAVLEVAARVREGTRRGQRPVSAMSLPTHPALSPAICSFTNKTGPAPRSLWVGLRVGSQGGSDAPCGRKRRRKSGRRLSPAGTSLPPRSNSHSVNGRAPLHEVGGARRASAYAGDCDCARSDPPWYGRARPRQGSARCARRGQHVRRDLDASSARPTEGNYRSEPEL